MAKGLGRRTISMIETLDGRVGKDLRAPSEGHSKMFDISPDLPKVIEMNIDWITPNPHQPRRHFDEAELTGLAQSIERHGLKQPILVQEAPGLRDRYVLVAGERRWRAHRLLGKNTIFAIITKGDAAEIAIVENVQRADLDALELAQGLQHLVDLHGYSLEELGSVIGRSKSEVSRTLQLLALPSSIREEYATSYRHISKSALFEIADMASDDEKLALWETIKGGATIKQIRSAKKSQPPRTDAEPATALHRSVQRLEQRLTSWRDSAAPLPPSTRSYLEALRERIDELLHS